MLPAPKVGFDLRSAFILHLAGRKKKTKHNYKAEN
jgi:hypothetical protein